MTDVRPYPKTIGQMLDVTLELDEGDNRLSRIVGKDGTVILDFADITFKLSENTTAPAVTPAEADVGGVLTCTTGVWNHLPLSYSFQWYRGDVAIEGATGATYTIVVGDAETNVSCKVSATNRAGAATAVASNAVAVPAGG